MELEDNEKFKDQDGNIIEITIRGDRDVHDCYFSVSDISRNFGIKSLRTTLLNPVVGYEEGVDFVNFISTKICSINKSKNKKTCKKSLYLTYNGLIRCLYVSRSGFANNFRSWANNILFTHQFGTRKQKKILASNLLGVDIDVVKEVFKTNANKVPCVYLFTLGTVEDLRLFMKIKKKNPNDSIVCKFGKTDNSGRRLMEHERDFKEIKGAKLRLKYTAYIDPQFISKAETYIKQYFESLQVQCEYKDYSELVILTPRQLKIVIKEQYKIMQTVYAGHNKELLDKIKDLEIEIKKLTRELEIKDNEQEYKLNLINESHENKMSLMNETYENKIEFVNQKYNNKINLIEEKHKNVVETLRNKHKNISETLENKHKNTIETLENKHKNIIELLDNKHKNELTKKDSNIEILQKELEYIKRENEILRNKIKININS